MFGALMNVPLPVLSKQEIPPCRVIKMSVLPSPLKSPVAVALRIPGGIGYFADGANVLNRTRDSRISDSNMFDSPVAGALSREQHVDLVRNRIVEFAAEHSAGPTGRRLPSDQIGSAVPIEI